MLYISLEYKSMSDKDISGNNAMGDKSANADSNPPPPPQMPADMITELLSQLANEVEAEIPQHPILRAFTQEANGRLRNSMRQSSCGDSSYIIASDGTRIDKIVLSSLVNGLCPICNDDTNLLDALLVNISETSCSTCMHGFCISCASEMHKHGYTQCAICNQSFNAVFNIENAELTRFDADVDADVDVDVDPIVVSSVASIGRTLTSGISIGRTLTSGASIGRFLTSGASIGRSLTSSASISRFTNGASTFVAMDPILSPVNSEISASDISDSVTAVYDIDTRAGMLSLVICAPNHPSGRFRGPMRLVIILIDASGSMKGIFSAVKSAVIRILQSASPDVFFTILTFANTVQQIVPPQKNTAITKSQIQDSVNNLRAGGSTNLVDGFNAISKVRDNFCACIGDENVNIQAIILNDGNADVAPTVADIPSGIDYWLMTFGTSVNGATLVNTLNQSSNNVRYSACNTSCQIAATLNEFSIAPIWGDIKICVPATFSIMMSAATTIENGEKLVIKNASYGDVMVIPMEIKSPDVVDASSISVTSIVGGVESEIGITLRKNEEILSIAVNKYFMKKISNAKTAGELEALRLEASNSKYSSYPCILQILRLIGTQYNMLNPTVSNTAVINTMTQARAESDSLHINRATSCSLRIASQSVNMPTIDDTDDDLVDNSVDNAADNSADDAADDAADNAADNAADDAADNAFDNAVDNSV